MPKPKISAINKVKDDGFGEVRQLIRDLAIEIRELRKSQKKTDEQIKKTDEQIKRTDKQVGALADGWGKFVEGLVAPSISTIFKKLGIKIDDISQRRKRYQNGKVMEVDILALGKKGQKEVVFVVEVKSSLESRDVDEFIKELSNFCKFFTEYSGREVYGVVAGVRFGNGAEKYAENNGLYVLAPSGETMIILNRPGFKPRIWR